MTEQELIAKIKELRQIKPNNEWVFLTKNRLFKEETIFSKISAIADFLPRQKFNFPLLETLRALALKPAYAGMLVVFILFGLFGFAQNSLPGDILYPIKKAAERSQVIFASKEEAANISLELVNKRLEELARIVEANQARKFAPAISEFQQSVSKIEATNLDRSAVKKVAEINRKKKELESLGGMVIDGEALHKLEMEFLVKELEYLISDLQSRSLTDEQEQVLNRVLELYKEGNYGEAALELYLINQ